MEKQNLNLLSRTQLEEIISEKNKEIESLKKSYSYRMDNVREGKNLFWRLLSIYTAIPTFFVCLSYKLCSKHEGIFIYYLSIGLFTLTYSLYKFYSTKSTEHDDVSNEVDDIVSGIQKPFNVKKLSTDELNFQLKSCIENEKYENAALIREELSNRVNNQ